jgi:hypothetical protein
MEVHHHAHPAISGTGTTRKKWTHYFWEFIMLFLAVFCGFLAENFREHKIEHAREVQFIKSLIADLQDDQASIPKSMSENTRRVMLMDSFLTLVNTPESLRLKGNDVYYMARVGPRINSLTINNKTFEQLKNSGSFRLIRNNEIAARIVGYYNKFAPIEMLQRLYFEEFSEYKPLAAKIFEPLVFRSMENEDGTISREANNPQLRTTDRELLKEFGIYIVYMNGTIRSIIPAEADLLKDGKELMAFLKEKYHLR